MLKIISIVILCFVASHESALGKKDESDLSHKIILGMDNLKKDKGVSEVMNPAIIDKKKFDDVNSKINKDPKGSDNDKKVQDKNIEEGHKNIKKEDDKKKVKDNVTDVNVQIPKKNDDKKKTHENKTEGHEDVKKGVDKMKDEDKKTEEDEDYDENMFIPSNTDVYVPQNDDGTTPLTILPGEKCPDGYVKVKGKCRRVLSSD